MPRSVLSFREAVELLGISDVEALTAEDLPVLERTARRRWHPDTVSHRHSAEDAARYTRQFQLIDSAIEVVRQFIGGTMRAGPATTARSAPQDPEEIIRREAHMIQSKLKASWPRIKAESFKWSETVVRVSDGYRLRDLIDQDFADDIAALSMVSFAYGFAVFGLGGAVLGTLVPWLGVAAGILWFTQALACVLGGLPLARYWLPESVQKLAIPLVNAGLKMYRFAERESDGSDKLWLQFVIHFPALLASTAKYVLVWPSHELAKLIVGDRMVGVVDQRVSYYGGFAAWYIEELLSTDPASLSREKVIDLGQLYSSFGGFDSET